jgi:hypothetical protein
MSGLLPLLLDLAPTTAAWVISDKTGDALHQVLEIATEMFGTDDPRRVAHAIADDLEKEYAFRKAVIEAESADRQRVHDEIAARLSELASSQSPTLVFARAASILAWGAAVVSLCVLLTFGFVLWVVLTKKVPTGQESLIYVMLGALTTMAAGVVGYWVGATPGSDRKDALLMRHTITPVQ